MAQVSDSMRSLGRRTSDQYKVWENIAKKSARFGVGSETLAMEAIFARELGRLEDYSKYFSPIEGQSGAVFAIDGKVVGLELFDSAETLKKLLPKLMQSYGLDAIDSDGIRQPGKKESCASGDVESFLERVAKAKKEEFEAVGEGRDVRLSGEHLTGAALVVDKQVIHLSAFAVK